ncbi:MAG: GWxTD domain-containing protein [Cytophagales bacterium]|nr:GWxTD domain-containing protein [Cytophagales bacterium]MDW8383620.1 GWxTD domain-containing protein [Flammeovirgaceae bacterium]
MLIKNKNFSICGKRLFYGLWLLFNLNAYAQKISYQYLKEIKSDFSVKVHQNTIDALLVFEIPRLSPLEQVNNIAVVYTLYDSIFQIIETDSLEGERLFCYKKNLAWHFPLKIEYLKEQKPFSLEIVLYDLLTSQKVQHQYLFGSSSVSSIHDSLKLIIKNAPTVGNYAVRVNDTLWIESKQTKEVFLYFFGRTFAPALPPMIVNHAENMNFEHDTVLVVRTNEPFVLSKTGLYFLKESILSQTGIPILVTPEDFPKYKKIHRVIEPLIYISSQREMAEFYSTDDKKRTLDAYWINIAGNPEKAKNLIKTYYTRVSYANKYFSGYKEGWKTDQGIIYIVFGEPTQIISYENKEIWVYGKNAYQQEIRFEFYKKHTLFCNNCYELARKVEYKEEWYNAVDKWRTGFLTKD